MPSGFDFFMIRQGHQTIDPVPRVNRTEPLPEVNKAAQYKTSGPAFSRTLPLGKTGMSAVVACAVESEPKLT